MDTETPSEQTSPLTDLDLKSRRMDVRRHEVRPASSSPAFFDVTADITADDTAGDTAAMRAPKPEVTVEAVGAGRWRVRVATDAARPVRVERAAPELIRVSRRSLLSRTALSAAASADPLSPSLPVGDDRVAIHPRLPRQRQLAGLLRDHRDVRPTTVFAPDGRGVYYDERYPWRCLVRMTRPSGWSGSGVLIGPRHVLTASHCVDWTPGWLRVDVLYTNSSSLATAYGTHAYFTEKVTGGNYGTDNMDDDFSVIVLDDPVGERFGWLGTRTYSNSWDARELPWRNIGYPQDLSSTGELAAYQRDFTLDEVDDDPDTSRTIVSSTFDNWPGQSGSPIFGFWDDGPYVVGVTSGESSATNFIAGGETLTGLVRRARQEHP